MYRRVARYEPLEALAVQPPHFYQRESRNELNAPAPVCPSRAEPPIGIARSATNTVEAQTQRTETQRQNAEAARPWNPQDLPTWLTEETYKTRVSPALVSARTAGRAMPRSIRIICSPNQTW
jgi:hypothetical protein